MTSAATIAPAAHPAGLGAERARGPGERRAGVRLGFVELPVADGDAVHRDERQDHDDRGLEADGDHDEADRGRQAVGRGDRRERDHGAGQQTERAGLESLLEDVEARGVLIQSGSHAGPRFFPSGLDASAFRLASLGR